MRVSEAPGDGGKADEVLVLVAGPEQTFQPKMEGEITVTEQTRTDRPASSLAAEPPLNPISTVAIRHPSVLRER